MPKPAPQPISIAVKRARQQRIARLAREVGFVGKIEYKHVYSQSGGAQYGRGTAIATDLLTVYCEAFERDANPNDFSLEAIIAHERGHQLLARHPHIAPRVRGRMSSAGEEILASLLGAVVCRHQTDGDDLIAKATAELMDHGATLEAAVRQVVELRQLLEAML